MNNDSFAQVDKNIVKSAVSILLREIEKERNEYKEKVILSLMNPKWHNFSRKMTREEAEKRYERGWNIFEYTKHKDYFHSLTWRSDENQEATKLLSLCNVCNPSIIYLSSIHADLIKDYIK